MIKFLVCANTPGNDADSDSDSDCKNPLEPLREPAETIYSISQVLTSQLNTLFSGTATETYYYITYMLLHCCTHYLITICTTFNFETSHITFTIFVLYYTVSVHNVLAHWIHEGLSVTFLIVYCGVYICLLL